MAMASQKYCQYSPSQTDITRKWEISSFGLEKKWLHLTIASVGRQNMEISTLAMVKNFFSQYVEVWIAFYLCFRVSSENGRSAVPP
jgi:hypothetical protein